MQSITEPLRHLTRASVKWRWTEVEQEAFDKLKHSISENCFAYFDKTWDTEVHVDASPVGLSAVLVQVDPDNKSERRFVMVTSRQLTDVEKRYSQFEKEALAAVWGCERLWIYLLGHRFKLVTDNRAIQLIFANSASKPPARIERWGLRLTQFDFEIEHRPGASNIADFLSRHPDHSVSIVSLSEQQNADQYINMVVSGSVPQFLSRKQLAEATRQERRAKAISYFTKRATSKPG